MHRALEGKPLCGAHPHPQEPVEPEGGGRGDRPGTRIPALQPRGVPEALAEGGGAGRPCPDTDTHRSIRTVGRRERSEAHLGRLVRACAATCQVAVRHIGHHGRRRLPQHVAAVLYAVHGGSWHRRQKPVCHIVGAVCPADAHLGAVGQRPATRMAHAEVHFAHQHLVHPSLPYQTHTAAHRLFRDKECGRHYAAHQRQQPHPVLRDEYHREYRHLDLVLCGLCRIDMGLRRFAVRHIHDRGGAVHRLDGAFPEEAQADRCQAVPEPVRQPEQPDTVSERDGRHQAVQQRENEGGGMAQHTAEDIPHQPAEPFVRERTERRGYLHRPGEEPRHLLYGGTVGGAGCAHPRRDVHHTVHPGADECSAETHLLHDTGGTGCQPESGTPGRHL